MDARRRAVHLPDGRHGRRRSHRDAPRDDRRLPVDRLRRRAAVLHALPAEDAADDPAAAVARRASLQA